MKEVTTIYFFVRKDGIEESYKKFYSDRYHCHYFIRRNTSTGWFAIYNYNSMRKVAEYGPSNCRNKKVLMRTVFKYMRKLGINLTFKIKGAHLGEKLE